MNNQQAINLLKNLEQSLDDYCGLNDEGETAFRMAIAALELFGNAEQLPSAQPERKTGRWIYDNEAYPYGNPCGHYDCDQCGESVPHKTNFCPNCGAKMEVEHGTL